MEPPLIEGRLIRNELQNSVYSKNKCPFPMYTYVIVHESQLKENYLYYVVKKAHLTKICKNKDEEVLIKKKDGTDAKNRPGYVCDAGSDLHNCSFLNNKIGTILQYKNNHDSWGLQFSEIIPSERNAVLDGTKSFGFLSSPPNLIPTYHRPENIFKDFNVYSSSQPSKPKVSTQSQVAAVPAPIVPAPIVPAVSTEPIVAAPIVAAVPAVSTEPIVAEPIVAEPIVAEPIVAAPIAAAAGGRKSKKQKKSKKQRKPKKQRKSRKQNC